MGITIKDEYLDDLIICNLADSTMDDMLSIEEFSKFYWLAWNMLAKFNKNGEISRYGIMSDDALYELYKKARYSIMINHAGI